MIIFGFHTIQTMLEEGKKIQSIHVSQKSDQARIRPIKQEAQKKHIAWREYSDRNHFYDAYIHSGGDRGEAESTQGIFAIIEFNYADLDQVLEATASKKDGLLLFLDSITDPQNIGSILRSAAFFDVSGIIIPEDRTAPVTPTAIKISSGGAILVPVAKATNLVRAIELAKEKNIWVYGLSEHADTEISKVKFDSPSALVIGNEEKGLRNLVIKTCDQVVSLPSYGKLKSLNAATAAAVAMALVRKS